MSLQNRVLVVGSLNMDLVIRTVHLPKPGETLPGSYSGNFPGGKGANQSVAVAKLGTPVCMIGSVGMDTFGRQLISNLSQVGVDVSFIKRQPKCPTGIALITLDEQGQNTIVINSGANSYLSPSNINSSMEAFRTSTIVLLQLEIPLETVLTTVEIAKRYNLPVILNAAPAMRLDSNLLTKVDYLILNQTELEATLDMKPSGEEVYSAHRIMDMGVKNVVVTLGSRGALLLDNSRNVVQVASHKVPVIDTTAAGDAFVGAFAVALTEGYSPQEALRWGNLAGALAVTKQGAQTSLPSRSEFELFQKTKRTAQT
jgi:ribokinase